MNYKYLVLLADEDGCPIRFVTQEGLQEILNGEYGDNLNFLSEADLETRGKDPNYWSDGESRAMDLMVIEIKRIVIPQQRVVAWRLED